MKPREPTPADIERLRQLLGGASFKLPLRAHATSMRGAYIVSADGSHVGTAKHSFDDGDLLARAVSVVPWLLDEVAELRRRLDEATTTEFTDEIREAQSDEPKETHQ